MSGRPLDAWDLDPFAALLWAACVESALLIDVPCSACAERSGGWEWRWELFVNEYTAKDWAFEYRRRGWTVALLPDGGLRYRLHMARPCSKCAIDGKPTGHEPKSLALLFCDALDDPDARARLLVEAERLTGENNPLGVWLAAWLRSQCQTCGGSGLVDPDPHEPTKYPYRFACKHCGLQHPHANTMATMLLQENQHD